MFNSNAQSQTYRMSLVLLHHQEDKIAKAIRIFNDEIDRRKKILSQYRVTSISEYRKLTGETIRMSLFLLITFDAVKDSPFQEVFENDD